MNNNVCQTNFKGFIGRLFYKLSGMKILSFIISASSILVLVVVAKAFAGKISDEIVLKAISAVKDLAIGLFIARGAQNVAEAFGKKTGENGNGS